MTAKGKISAEEYRQQLAERMPIAARAMEKALGKTQAEIFKMLESGTAISEEVLPKFAVALRQVANEGGALDQALKTVGVTQNKFFTQLQLSQDKIFKAGFGEGVTDLFSTMTELFAENETALAGLGKIFRIVFEGIAFAARIITPVIGGMSFVIGEFSDIIRSLFISDTGKMIIGIVAMTVALKKMNFIFKSMAGRILMIFGLLDEVFSLFTKGRTGLFEELWFGGDIDPEKEFKGLLDLKDSLGSGGSAAAIIAAIMALKVVINKFISAAMSLVKALGGKVTGATGKTPKSTTGTSSRGSMGSKGVSPKSSSKPWFSPEMKTSLKGYAKVLGKLLTKVTLPLTLLSLGRDSILGDSKTNLEKMTQNQPVYHKYDSRNTKPTNMPPPKVEAHFHGVAPNTAQEVKEKMDEIFMMNSVGGYD